MTYSPKIKQAARALSQRYREGERPYLRTAEDREAYLITRLPATQAAIARVFEELHDKPLYTYLDIGAGPGTSWEPAQERWSLLQHSTFVEIDPLFVRLGKTRLEGNPITWKPRLEGVERHDMALFSYSWGEIDDLAVLKQAWQLCRYFLIVIEPGTPRGYASVLKARDTLIHEGASVFAPCPHSRRCPWQGTGEWCHFAVRLARGQEHRLAKEGSLGFEDEKFSYVILAKEPAAACTARLVKDPLKRKGHTVLTLCTEQGIETKTVSKKDKALFKQVNKKAWGDTIVL